MMIRLVEYFVLKNTGHKQPIEVQIKQKKKKKKIIIESNITYVILI